MTAIENHRNRRMQNAHRRPRTFPGFLSSARITQPLLSRTLKVTLRGMAGNSGSKRLDVVQVMARGTYAFSNPVRTQRLQELVLACSLSDS